jgi:putative membrane protein
MYTKKVYPALDMFMWTRYESFLFLFIGTIYVILVEYLGFTWLRIPWAPIAVIGSAVAFVIGFQNNSAYGRIWEARKIWGGIVNTSRTLGMLAQDMISNEHALVKLSDEGLQKEIKNFTYRHIAWMTALRHAMRQSKPWETASKDKGNKKILDLITVQEWQISLEDDLKPYLSAIDLKYVLSKNNKQTALLYLQSPHLKEMKDSGIVWEFSFIKLEEVLQELFSLQGKSERIKNFPYPRQFATLNHYFMWIFVLLLPLGVVPQFAEMGADLALSFPIVSKYFVWLSIPIYAIIAWVFHTMERIGRTGENPFEGLSNDVPISTIARGIEIDLRQNLGENNEDIPKQFPVEYDTQM